MTEAASFMNFQNVKTVLVTGAGGGIGHSFVEYWLNSYEDVTVFATVRNESRMDALADLKSSSSGERLRVLCLDADQESDYENLRQQISDCCEQLDVVINCIGYLHDESRGPEKRLADINPSYVMDSFRSNTLPVVLLAKHLFPLLKNSSPSLLASLSARVGSIEDNKSGGWYSYRASKAAHNMMLKNISFELERFRCHTLVVALHPGTTQTGLSKPFIGRTKYQLHTSDETAENLMGVMSGLTWSDNGSFRDWKGESIEW